MEIFEKKNRKFFEVLVTSKYINKILGIMYKRIRVYSQSVQ